MAIGPHGVNQAIDAVLLVVVVVGFGDPVGEEDQDVARRHALDADGVGRVGDRAEDRAAHVEARHRSVGAHQNRPRVSRVAVDDRAGEVELDQDQRDELGGEPAAVDDVVEPFEGAGELELARQTPSGDR